MAKYSYGVTKSERGIFNPVDGTISAWAEMEVYKDTITMEFPDPTETPHYKQGEANPKVIRRSMATPKSVAFSIMNTDADEKVIWMGGTKTTVALVDSWNEPKLPVLSMIYALRFTTEDGSVIQVTRGDCFTKPNIQPNDSNINLLDVKSVLTETGFPDVPNFKWDDAPNPAP